MRRIGWRIAVLIGVFMCLLDTTIMNVALPAISTDLRTPFDDLSWALSGYTIVFAALTIPLTRLAESFGRVRFFVIGAGLFALGSLVSGCATQVAWLVGGRLIQSVGAALVFPLAMIIGIAIGGERERRRMILLLGLTQGLAAAMGPLVGGLVTQLASWRWSFWLNLPLVAVVVGVVVLLPAPAQELRRTARIDILGSLTSIVSLACLTTGLIEGRLWGWGSLPTLAVFLVAVFSAVAFVYVERHQRAPMLPLELFANHQFRWAALVIVLSNLFLVGTTVLLPTFYTTVRGADSLTAAGMLLPIMVMVFVMSPLAGLLLPRLGARFLVGSGFLLMGIGYALLATGSLSAPKSAILASALLGAGYGLVTGPITVLAAADFEGTLLSASQSVAGVLRQVGVVLAIALFVSGMMTQVTAAKAGVSAFVEARFAATDLPVAVRRHVTQVTIAKIAAHDTRVVTKHTGVPALDQEITTTVADIRETVQRRYRFAFENVYCYAVVFVFLSALVALKFKKL